MKTACARSTPCYVGEVGKRVRHLALEGSPTAIACDHKVKVQRRTTKMLRWCTCKRCRATVRARELGLKRTRQDGRRWVDVTNEQLAQTRLFR